MSRARTSLAWGARRPEVWEAGKNASIILTIILIKTKCGMALVRGRSVLLDVKVAAQYIESGKTTLHSVVS